MNSINNARVSEELVGTATADEVVLEVVLTSWAKAVTPKIEITTFEIFMMRIGKASPEANGCTK